MRINHNISALNTHRQMSTNTISSSKSMEKLSSGLRINRAADDAAGLSISEKMRSQIRALNQSVRNAQDGISLIQTAEGALNEVSDMLVRIKELAVQITNGTYSATDKMNLGREMSALGTAAEEVIENTSFNGISVFTQDVVIAYGDDAGTTLTIKAYDTTGYLGVDPDPGVPEDDSDLKKLVTLTDTLSTAIAAYDPGTPATVTALNDAIAAITASVVDNTITEVNSQRATYGANQNKLEHVVNNLSTTAENIQASESRIRDVDMAKEMMEFTKNNILLQAAQAMLAQANSQPQGVLQLLR